jgi:hypothetical protein
MRRIALAMATVGMIAAAGMASMPAQAHEGWGGQEWRQHEWRAEEWREHHDWRAHAFERHVVPQIIYGFVHHR